MALSATATVKPGLPPQVEVYLQGAELSGGLTTLYRVTPDGAQVVVRGVKNYPTSGPLYVVDFEAPFDVDVRYQVVSVKANVTTTSPLSNVVRLYQDMAYLSDPLTPGSGVRVYVADGSWVEQERQVTQDVFMPLGRRWPVAVSGVRKAPSYSIGLTHPGDTETATIRRLLETANPALLRMSDARYGGWTGGYIATGAWKEKRWANSFAKRTRVFELPVVEVQSPSASAVISLWNWSDVKSLYSTWGAVRAGKPNWAELLRNPTP